ncbi:MAG: metalloprotease TldD [Gammaproteobacteria bacterium]|nr:metalloprotease TldD [Gammaproteobacteria bacterium]
MWDTRTIADEVLGGAGLDLAGVETALSELGRHRIDLGELYFQHQRMEAWSLEDRIVKDGSYSVDRGVGVRAVSGEKTGYAYVEDISAKNLHEAIAAVRGIARSGGDGAVRVGAPLAVKPMYTGADPISGLDERSKVNLLRELDATARSIDVRVSQVTVRIAASHETILVLATDGTFAADRRPLVRLDVSVIVDSNGRRERGSSGGGGRFDLAEITSQGESHVREAVRMALVNLDALPAPAGPMPVVLGPGWPAVLLHEAVGHGLEGDFNRKGTSTFSGRIGELVASKHCTVVDDGSMFGRRGSLSIDDEGTPCRETVLIENGILRGYLQDKLNARLMGASLTGNGRRQSYAHMPMPRMTNTFMRPGKHTPEEIIASVDKGIYAVNFGGGQVDITSGQFVFSATEAYLISGGKVTEPIRGATLIGNGPDVMRRISMVGNDLGLDRGVGVCGKDGQSIPVGVGQPTLRIDEVNVGGTQA